MTQHIITRAPPVHCKPRRHAPKKLKVSQNEFVHLLQPGIACPSSSPLSSALHMVPNKTAHWRPCGDHRAFNAITVPDSYPIPNIQDCTALVSGAFISFRLDYMKPYHQIPVETSDMPKTDVTKPFRLFEYFQIHFGLGNSAQTIQRSIDEVTRVLPYCFAYLDDILIASADTETHKNHLRQL